MMSSAGRVAYTAYRNHTGGKSLATGQPIPKWGDLPAPIREAWDAAADATSANRDKVRGLLYDAAAFIGETANPELYRSICDALEE